MSLCLCHEVTIILRIWGTCAKVMKHRSVRGVMTSLSWQPMNSFWCYRLCVCETSHIPSLFCNVVVFFAVLLKIITTIRQRPDRQMWRLWYWSPSSPRQVWSKTFRWEKLPVIIFLVSAIPGLLEPLKVRRRLDVDSNEHVEDVPLVHVHRDQRLELRPLHLRQVLHCLADQAVQDVQELVVRVAHYLMMFSWKTRAEVTKTKTNILMFFLSTFVFCIQKRKGEIIFPKCCKTPWMTWSSVSNRIQDLLVHPAIAKSLLRISSPDHLDPKNADLFSIWCL